MNPKPSVIAIVTTLLMGLTHWAADAMAVMVESDVLRASVVSHVQHEIQPFLPDENPPKVSVEILHMPFHNLAFPDADSLADLDIEPSSSLSKSYSNRTVVRLNITGPTGRSVHLGVPVKITVNKPVWVVKNLINPGQSLSKKDFRLETRDVSRELATAVGPERQLSDYLARVNLRPGDVLDARKIILPPAVSRNGLVRIILTGQEGMRISMNGIALQDGYIGQQVRVYHQNDRNRRYNAKVIGKNRVLVSL